MAKRKHVENLREMAENYNRKTPVMAERWSKAKAYIAERWAASLQRLLGAPVDSTFVEALRTGVEKGAPKYAKNIQGAGDKLVKHYYEKLTAKVKS
jgi:pyruvate-formate lyase